MEGHTRLCCCIEMEIADHNMTPPGKAILNLNI